MNITNESSEIKKINLASFINKKQDAFKNTRVLAKDGKIYFTHIEEPDGWTKDHHLPMVDSIRDLFQFSSNVSSAVCVNDLSFNENIFEKKNETDSAHLIGFRKDISLQPHQSGSYRIFRIVQPLNHPVSSLEKEADSLEHASIVSYKKANEHLYSKTPLPVFKDSASMALYW